MRICIATIYTTIHSDSFLWSNRIEIIKECILKYDILRDVIVHIGIRFLTCISRRSDIKVKLLILLRISSIIFQVGTRHIIIVWLQEQLFTCIIESCTRSYIYIRLADLGINTPTTAKHRELRISGVAYWSIPAQSANGSLIKHIDAIAPIIGQPCKRRVIDSDLSRTRNITSILTTTIDIVVYGKVTLTTRINGVESWINIFRYYTHELFCGHAS